MFVCEAGDVAIVPFPFTDVARAKPRPALALSPAKANVEVGNTVFAMITTAARSQWPTDIALRDLDSAGLQHASSVRLKLFTLDNRIVERRIGALSGRDRQAVRHVLRAVIGI